MNTVGEPCEGKPHARIDEGRLARPFAEPAAYSTLMGHARLETTRAYTRPTAEDRAKALVLLPVDR
jgi:hypothetical protein